MIQRSVALTIILTGLAAHHAAALVFDDGKAVPGAGVKALFTTVTIPSRPPAEWRQSVVIPPRESTFAWFDVGDGPGETEILLGAARQDGTDLPA